MASHSLHVLARTWLRTWLLILGCLGGGMLAPTASLADPADPLSRIFSRSPDFLPVAQAFPVDAERSPDDTVAVYFEITPEYYLYRHGFAFSVDGRPVEPLQWPRGEQHEDEYFGQVEVYRGNLEFRLPLPKDAGDPANLRVGYQGCADAGLCYPPAEVFFEVTADAVQAVSGPPAAAGATSRAPDPPPSAMPAPAIQGLFWFLLAGLGLTFTPCVLPMLPILSSVILGPGQRVSTARATALTVTYVGSMAVTFALAGVLVGYFGARLNLQAHLQNPWVIGSFAGLFVLLALSMFDLYEIRMPAGLERLAGAAGGTGSLPGAALMGAVSSLVVSPCVTAPLAGALLYIAATGDALYGGLALLALGGGMGIPLLVAGIGGGRFLPRSGPWMVGIKRIFGVLMIGVAIWMLERFLAGPVSLALWAGLAVFTAAGAHAFAQQASDRLRIAATTVAMTSFLLGGIWLTGALTGGSDMWRPLDGLGGSAAGQSDGDPFHDRFVEVTDLAGLDGALANARGRGEPVFLDIYADWCISCRIMEREVLGSQQVQEKLADFALIRADVTANTPESARILERYGVFGPPAWIFLDRQGGELAEMRVIGEIHEDDFISHLDRHKSLL